MPTLKLYLNGFSAGTAGHNPAPSPRGIVSGWSPAAVRRHTRWLYSVESPELAGQGYAVTLTMREVPESSEAFHAAREAFFQRMRRWGMIRGHWVVEWTRRGRPHLHIAVYFPDGWAAFDEVARQRIVQAWLGVSAQWGTESPAQYVLPIDGAVGWLQYLSKHAARGVAHYQRQGKPEGWEKTGRLWGHMGSWPTHDPMAFDVSREGYWRIRRLIRAWRIADARQALIDARTPRAAAAARRRITAARGMLSCDSRRLSEVRGISEWVPEHLTGVFLALIVAEGQPVIQK